MNWWKTKLQITGTSVYIWKREFGESFEFGCEIPSLGWHLKYSLIQVISSISKCLTERGSAQKLIWERKPGGRHIRESSVCFMPLSPRPLFGIRNKQFWSLGAAWSAWSSALNRHSETHISSIVNITTVHAWTPEHSGWYWRFYALLYSALCTESMAAVGRREGMGI